MCGGVLGLGCGVEGGVGELASILKNSCLPTDCSSSDVAQCLAHTQ